MAMETPTLPPTTCPRCGAALRPEQASLRNGPPGYQPAIRWIHRNPRTGRPCHVDSGPPVGYSPPQRPERVTTTTEG